MLALLRLPPITPEPASAPNRSSDAQADRTAVVSGSQTNKWTKVAGRRHLPGRNLDCEEVFGPNRGHCVSRYACGNLARRCAHVRPGSNSDETFSAANVWNWPVDSI